MTIAKIFTPSLKARERASLLIREIVEGNFAGFHLSVSSPSFAANSNK